MLLGVLMTLVRLATTLQGANNSESIIMNLRRQLMYNNYDYKSEESNYAENTFETSNINNITTTTLYVSKESIEEEGNVFDDKDTNEEKEETATEVVTKKDPLYTIDKKDRARSQKLKRSKNKRLHRSHRKIKSTAKYKFLKVKRQYRRSGKARLLQEEDKEGVAIVNLDKGPFPEFKLPNSRRQYMDDRGEVEIEEEEIPPVTINSSDPEAALVEIENTTAMELPDV